MSELQLGLIGLGVLLVAAVWGFNVWQEKKFRERTAKMFPADTQDVLMAGREEEERSEPGIAPPEGAVPREPTFSAEFSAGASEGASEDALAKQAAEESAAEEGKAIAGLPPEWADGRADCLVRIEFVDAVPATGLWAEKDGWRRLIDKPTQWLGLDADSKRWRTLRPQDPGTVTQLAVALQLADRKGAVSEATLAAFLGATHELAKRFSGLVELPEHAPVLARAAELDAFCAAVDLQLALHVVPRPGSLNEMIGAKLKPLIDAEGLRIEGERFVATDAEGNEIFALTLSCNTAQGDRAARLETLGLTGLSFGLDVPRVREGAVAFDHMLDMARASTTALGGQLADAHGNALSDATIAAIRSRIVELQERMARQNIPPGSVRALRLFS